MRGGAGDTSGRVAQDVRRDDGGSKRIYDGVMAELAGPKGGFLGLGNARALRRDLLGFYRDNAGRYGDACGFRIGPIRCFQFSHPEQHQEVLVEKAKSFSKPARLRRVLGQWNGNGLVVNEGESWVRQRRLTNPAFKPQRIARYVGIVNRRADALLAGWQAGAEVDASAAVYRLTFGVVAEALFGSDVEAHTERFASEVAVLNDLGLREMSSPIIWPMWFPTPAKRRIRRATRYLQSVADAMIAAHRKAGEDRGNLLSAMLQVRDDEAGGDGGQMTDRQARDESINLMLGGAETTGTAVLWTLHLLSTHPEEQARVRQELAEVLGGRAPTADDVPRLVWVERCFQEALRLYPPAYLLPREAIEDVEVAGHALPRGAQVTLVVYVTQRDPRWFPEPEAFRPARFEGEPTWPKGAYLPFGLGPRACIGRGFATTEAVVALARLLQRFGVKPAGAVDPVAQVSLHPREALRLALVAGA